MRRKSPRAQTEWFLRGRTAANGTAAEHLRRAYQQKLRARADRAARIAAARAELLNGGSGITSKQLSAAASILTSAGNTSAVWMPVGPPSTATAASDLNQDYGPAVGRVTAIAVDQNDLTGNTIYVGGAYGGLWRSRNAADASRSLCPPNSNAMCAPNVQWEPLLDDQPTLAVGAIAVRPGDSNWILVGTGEAHNSADSYYGMGFLLSKDGGASWTLKDSAITREPLHGLGITRIAFNRDNPNIVVAAAAAASAGVRLGAETGGSAARGLYYSFDAGQTWSKASVQDSTGAVTAASANSVVYNPANHTFYANLRFHGFYSSPNGASWTRLANQPGGGLLSQSACPTQPDQNCPLFRAEMAVVPGRNELYVWIVDANGDDRGIFQTLDGGTTWNSVPVASLQNCGEPGCDTEQGVYDLTLTAVPDGSATDLYAGAVNLFKCRLTSPDNPASCTFVDLTHVYGCAPAGSYSNVHPDQQAVDFPAQHPELMYFGNDGGVYRTLNSFAVNSGSCVNPPSSPWFDNLDFSSVPGAGLGSMLQFVSMSQHPGDASVILGGTQDNGSPATSDASASNGTWLAANSGDGGFNAINPNNGDEWFTSAPGDESPAFNIDIERCTLGTSCTPSDFQHDQVVGLTQTGGDSSSFYPPYILDPQMPNRLIAGSCRVWRGNSDGTGEWGTPGSPLSINFAADPAGSTTSTACSSSHTMLASVAVGGPVTPSLGSQVVWAGQEGNGTDTGGEVWVTLHADNGPSSWRRALSAGTTCSGTPFNPGHYNISDIALDANDASGRTAFVTVMGFTNGNSGHVFKVQVTDAPNFSSTCTDISGNMPDAPADSVVMAPSSPTTLYAGTDVGVFVTHSAVSGAVWDEVGPVTGPGALPNVVVTRLKVFTAAGGAVKLRAATYGRGIWEASLTPDLQMVLGNSTVYAFSGIPKTLSGQVFALSGYNDPVTITCEDTGSGLPSVCDGGGPVSPSATGTPFFVTVGHPSVQDFTFNLKATGTDGTVHSYPVTLHVGDFDVSASPDSLDVPHGNSGNSAITLAASGTVNTGINFSCGLASGGPLPAGLTCSPAPSSLTLSGPSANSTLLIGVTQSVAAGSYVLRITAASADNSVSRTANLTVNVNVNPRFELQPSSNSMGTAKPGQTLSMAIPIHSLDGYGDTTVAMSCWLSGTPGAASCEVSPNSVNLPSGSTQQVTVSIHTVGALASNSSLTVTGSDSSSTASATLSYSIQDYRVMAPTLELIPGGGATGAVELDSDNGYSGTVVVSCDPAGFAGNPCSISPAGPVAITPAAGGTVNLTITAPLNTPAGTKSVLLKSNDTSLPSVIRQISVPVKIYDYKLTVANISATIPAGQSANFSVALTSGPDPFPQRVTFACSGLPQLSSCSFSPSELPAGSSSGTVQVTIRTTAVTVAVGSPSKHSFPALAMWLGIAGLGLVVGGGHPTRRSKWMIWLALLLAIGLGSCGGGTGNGLNPPIPQPGTPSGNYAITIQGSTTGTVGSAERSTQVTLIVQ